MIADTQDLLRLADGVEKATGPDRALDRDIADALGLGPDDSWERRRSIPGVIKNMAESAWIKNGRIRESKPYTASLDAAMTLVPEGWGWFVSQPNEKAIASGLLKRDTPVMGEVQYGCDHRYPVAAATPALALCAAALKARAHSTKETSNG